MQCFQVLPRFYHLSYLAMFPGNARFYCLLPCNVSRYNCKILLPVTMPCFQGNAKILLSVTMP